MITTDDGARESVSIKANFPFGVLSLETIELIPKGLPVCQSDNSDDRTPTNVVKTSTLLEIATIRECWP